MAFFAPWIRSGLFARRAGDPAGEVFELARALLTERGESAGVQLAQQTLAGYAELDAQQRTAWMLRVAQELGADPQRMDAAIDAWRADPADMARAQDVHRSSEPLRQELIRRLNLAPGGTAALVAMRSDLLARLDAQPALRTLDEDFSHLFASWFNRGFLTMRRIEWSTPADILERIIRYEAVHTIDSWEELRRRVEPADRRCFAFFHPALPGEPLIFVEVALVDTLPRTIGAVLESDRRPRPPEQADMAVFYSISNCQAGLRGVSFGHFLLKQVIDDLLREHRGLKTFVTLSPVPGFGRWIASADARDRLGAAAAEALQGAFAGAAPSALDGADEALHVQLEHAVLTYLIEARDRRGRPRDPVARFHLGNGARLQWLHPKADLSTKGRREAAGFMVSYQYELASIERRHEAYARRGEMALSTRIRRLHEVARRRVAEGGSGAGARGDGADRA